MRGGKEEEEEGCAPRWPAYSVLQTYAREYASHCFYFHAEILEFFSREKVGHLE